MPADWETGEERVAAIIQAALAVVEQFEYDDEDLPAMRKAVYDLEETLAVRRHNRVARNEK